MAKVQLEVARMGFEFQGAAALSVVGTWVDEAGTPTSGPMPVTPLNIEDNTAVCYIRWSNPNTEDKSFSSPTALGPSPVASASIAGFIVPAEGTYISTVTVGFDGSQERGDVAFIDIAGESDA